MRTHCNLRCQSAATICYNTANNLEQGQYAMYSNNAFAATTAALEGLAEATQSDCIVVANLTLANNPLTNQVKDIGEMKTMIKELTQEKKGLKDQ